MLNPEIRRITILVCMAVLCGCSGYEGEPAAAPVYTIEGEPVQLDVEGENSTTWMMKNAAGDLNGDGQDDHAAVLSQNTGGTGVFYYLNVFLNDGKDGWQFVGEEFLGDRIKFDFLDIYAEGSVSQLTDVPIHPDDYGQLVVAYATHTVEQSFAEEPGNYLTRHFKVQDGSLVALDAD